MRAILDEEVRVRAVGASEVELLEETRHPAVDHAVALAAGLLGERAGDEGLADAGRSGDDDVVVLLDPAAGRELADLGAVELSLRRVVDVLDAGLAEAELGLSQPAREAAVVAEELLGVDEHGEALVEAEAAILGS